jgi:hypothetical protein
LRVFGQRLDQAAFAGNLPVERARQGHDPGAFFHTGVSSVGVRLRFSALRKLRQSPPDVFHFHPPEICLARLTVREQLLVDESIRGLFNNVFRVTWEMRQHLPSERPTRPRPPTSLIATRFIHTSGVMLKMNSRISDEYSGRRVSQKPRHSGVRKRPLPKRLSLAGHIGAKRAVETENRPGRLTSSPEIVSIFEHRYIKLLTTLLAVSRQIAPVHVLTRQW